MTKDLQAEYCSPSGTSGHAEDVLSKGQGGELANRLNTDVR